MGFRDLVEIIWRNMWKRKARTVFTMMGVIIGCLAIFIISSITNGFEKYLTDQMNSMMDTSVIEIMPNHSSNPEDKNAKTELNEKSIKELEELGIFAELIPKRYGNTTMKLKSKRDAKAFASVLAKEEFKDITEEELIAGHIPKKGSKEVLLGHEVAKELLGYGWGDKVQNKEEFNSLVGQKLILGGESYSIDEKGNEIRQKEITAIIVGVLPQTKNAYSYEVIGSNKLVDLIIRSEVFLPEEEILKNLKTYQTINGKVDDKTKLAEYEAKVKELGYNAYSSKEFEKETRGMLLGVNLVLGSLAGISLLVATLGITNTMDMAIYERNKEIGVMKVIGGGYKDIIRIFVGEACAISVAGGVISILAGGILSFVINLAGKSITEQMLGAPIDKIAIPTLSLILGILAFCLVIGYIAGIRPAKKAAKVDIITAIR